MDEILNINIRKDSADYGIWNCVINNSQAEGYLSKIHEKLGKFALGNIIWQAENGKKKGIWYAKTEMQYGNGFGFFPAKRWRATLASGY